MAKGSKAVSKAVDMEPTLTKTLQNEFSRKLRVIVRKLRRRTEDWVMDQPTRQQSSRELASAEFSMEEFRSLIEKAGQSIIIGQGESIVTKYAETSYNKGKRDAESRTGDDRNPDLRGQMGAADWRALDQIKARNLSLLKRLNSDLSAEIVRSVEEGMRNGENPREIAKRISDRTEHVGIYRANVIGRTETITAYNRGAAVRYEQYGYDALQWFTARDERVCPICAPRHEKIYKKDEAPENPAHPQCRCTWFPADSEA